MSTYGYYPTRPAPAPPSDRRPCDELPADHPFLNPYTPTPQLKRSSSCSSLDSMYTIQTPPASIRTATRAYTASPAIGSYPSSLSRSPRSPPSSVSAPLTPSRSTQSAPNPSSRPRPSHYPTAPSPRSPAFIPLPTELSLFDTRPRNLLADLEYIAGKKLHFPFLQRRKGQEKEVAVKAEKAEKRVVSGKSEKSGSPTRLTKERQLSEEQQDLYEAVSFRDEKARPVCRRGRGVREGNWI